MKHRGRFPSSATLNKRHEAAKENKSLVSGELALPLDIYASGMDSNKSIEMRGRFYT